MFYRILFSTMILGLSSCATLSSKIDQDLAIETNAEEAKVLIRDTTYELPTNIRIRRSKYDLDILLLTDTSKVLYTVKSAPSPVFLLGNIFLFSALSPIAYMIDFTNQKRFYYGDTVFLDIHDSSRYLRPPTAEKWLNYKTRKYVSNKGQINAIFTIPYVNSFYLQPQYESSKSNTGFWGVSAGMEYFYRDSRSICLSVNAASDIFFPLPAAVDIGGEYETMGSAYINLMHNTEFNRLIAGFGINYTRNIWSFIYDGRFGSLPQTRPPVSRVSESLGLTFNGYYRVGKHFHLGLIYRPTFLTVRPEVKLQYEHLISLDLAWKFRLKN